MNNSDRAGTAVSDLPKPKALFETSLQDSISSSASSMTLVSSTDKDGNTLASSTYGFIIDEGAANEELVLAACTGTACTFLVRGVSVDTGTSTVAALAKSHRRGAPVKITDAPLLLTAYNLLNGSQDLPRPIRYSSSITNAQISADNENLVNYNLLAATSFSGTVDSSGTVKGIVELVTGNEAASTTGIGGGDTTAALALYSGITTANPQSSGYWAIMTRNDGKIDINHLATSTDPLQYGGAVVIGMHEASSTLDSQTSLPLTVDGDALITGTTTVGALNSTSSQAQFGELLIKFPETVGAASTSWFNDGTGGVDFSNAFAIADSVIPNLLQIATTTSEQQHNTNTAMLTAAYVFPHETKVRAISCYVKAVGTSGTLDLTVYTENGQTQKIAITTASITATGIVTTAVSPSVTLQPGVYYFGVNTNSTADITLEGYTNSQSPLSRTVSGKSDLVGLVTISAGSPPATFNPVSDLADTGQDPAMCRFDN